MASDVEVLRALLAWAGLDGFEMDIGPGYYDETDAKCALSSAISALEAQEAGGAVAMCMTCRHPRKRYGCDGETCRVLAEARGVPSGENGRIGNDRLSEILRIHPLQRSEADDHELMMELGRARASEAALSERVAMLTGRIREAIKICDANTQSQMAARIYDVLRHGFTHDAAPPSKPETP